MQTRKRKTIGSIVVVSLVLAASVVTVAWRTNASAAGSGASVQLRTMVTASAESQTGNVTSTNPRTACKRGCVDRYNSCLAAKKAKGWSDDRAEKICGLAARSCKKGCER